MHLVHSEAAARTLPKKWPEAAGKGRKRSGAGGGGGERVNGNVACGVATLFATTSN